MPRRSSSASTAGWCYAGVVRTTIRHAGQSFAIAGPSCVATDPAYRGRGFATRAVAAATRSIEHSDRDVGIFTCDPPLARFYARAGAWPVVPHVVLVGSRDEGALDSTPLGKAGLMRLFSAKARAAAEELSHTTIDLGLPVGQFLWGPGVRPRCEAPAPDRAAGATPPPSRASGRRFRRR
ncbi:hypothetical protein QNA08_06715 [Chelatococcus sp. SYSU_G07232]|uniref:N-acetyltransferase domain-containing protein n=1 Tax=Chelatococcus albus TaxID=3047466 RepID=A0ABT7AEY1_9HYPH|nr:hypothetical protein [Chelatococcus sp. SYSU_G07232]MDJ1157924.1 hypothetical protein [Chelatococcus sp. SYSU_G07232]